MKGQLNMVSGNAKPNAKILEGDDEASIHISNTNHNEPAEKTD